MNKRTFLLFASCIIGVAAIAGALLCEAKSDRGKQRPTLEYTDEKILELPYFEVVAAGGENRGLLTDVVAYCLGDNIVHMLLPDSVDARAVVVYLRDGEGKNLARRVLDLRQDASIGPWIIRLEHHTLPTIYFESEDPAVYELMNEVEEKDIICNGNFQIYVSEEDAEKNGWYREYLSTSEPGLKGNTASLQGRGSTSWDVDHKRSYSLRLGKSQNLLGMGKNRNWNLIGNVFDRSVIKNITFNDMCKKIGIEYQPNMMDVNLYVDGRYRGVYTLTTKISRDKERVALKHGDFFYRLDPPEPENPIRYDSTAWFQDGFPYPVADLVYPENPSEEEMERASEILQRFITLRDDSSLPGLEKVCDLEDLAKFYWMQEIMMNFDACSRSIYMYYRQSDGKIHFGPVWDMDLTLGSPYKKEDVDLSEPQGWKIRNLGWYVPLFERPEFVDVVNDVYYNGGIREALLEGEKEFEKNREALGNDGSMNYMFYGQPVLYEVCMNYGDTYDEYCDNMIAFYKDRAKWIDEEMKR